MKRLWIVLVSVSMLAGCGSSPDTDADAAAEPASVERGAPGDFARPQADPPASIVEAGPAGLEVARRYTQMFYAGELEQLFAKFSPEMQTTLPLEKLTEMYENVRDKLGPETAVVGEQSRAEGEYRIFLRRVHFEHFVDDIDVLWTLRGDDSIAGFFLRPATRPEP